MSCEFSAAIGDQSVEQLRRELAEAREEQAATAEIIRVISSTPNDLQRVMSDIAAAAARLCDADEVVVRRLAGDSLQLVGHHGAPPVIPSLPLNSGTVAGRAVLGKQTVHVPDLQAHTGEHPEEREIGLHFGDRTVLAVPLIRVGDAIGVIVVRRREVRLFSDKHIALLVTLAHQAVVAIENTRLATELRETIQLQMVTAEVLKAISRSALDLQAVLNALVSSASNLCDAPMAAIYVAGDGALPGRARHGFSPDVVAALSNMSQVMGRGSLAGRVISERKPVHIPDVDTDHEYANHEFTRITGARSMLGIPLLRDGRPIGLLSLYRTRVAPFAPRQMEMIATFADQAVIAIENVRLFDEIAQKSRELEIASQHKSQFVANMSHELRTPLAAMLGYAELLQEGIYGALPEKSMPILARICSNGKHLLGLINTVLDISKIEAGQFKLNSAEYALDSIVETVMVATESLAASKKLAFRTEVAEGLPYGLGDEQRLTQVLLNLVGNAIKFTDAGEVCITAGANNGHFTLSVADTGPGIPPEERERIFEKFRQVDSSNTRAKPGTGLGLAIAKEIVELHGGSIWVESVLGHGSTFRLELPVRAATADGAV